MKLTEAIYTHTFHNIVTGEWDKVGLIGELEEGDDYRQCLYTIRKNVHNFYHESTNADKKNASENHAVEKVVQIGITPEDIYACTDLKVLENSYKYLVKNKPKLQDAYNEQFKKLSQ